MPSTRLITRIAPFPENFKGAINVFVRALADRIETVSPFGEVQIRIGGLKPTSNQGPWLKDGTKWYVWSESLKDYVPLDINDSLPTFFWTGSATPASTTPNIWLRTFDSGASAAWYFYNGTTWITLRNEIPSGTTTNRPASPRPLEQYFDTDLNVLIWFERDIWRTVSGAPGDTKYVRALTIDSALTINPGWAQVETEIRGRVLVAAGAGLGLTNRPVGSSFGAETHVLTVDEMPAHAHGYSKYHSLTGVGGANPIWANEAAAVTGPAGGDAPHNNMPPSYAFFLLYKL